MKEVKNEKSLGNAWDFIEDYEKSLKGWKLVSWRIRCFFDDIGVFLLCKSTLLKGRFFKEKE